MNVDYVKAVHTAVYMSMTCDWLDDYAVFQFDKGYDWQGKC